MAIFRLEAKIISRGGGRSTVASASYRTGGKSAISAAAYRAGVELTDERTGTTYDYTLKRGIAGAEIMLPEGAPAWMANRARLWNHIEMVVEKRKDAQLAKDYILTLPHELTHAQRVELTLAFVKAQFVDKGYVADIAWHGPSKRDGLNHHAHVMVTMRKIENGAFARVKERTPAGLHPMKFWQDELIELRHAWAETANQHLQAAGHDIQLDARSLMDRGIDREAEQKLGPVAAKMEAEGRESHAGDDLRAIRARNAEREALKDELAKAIAEEAQIINLMTHRLARNGFMKNERPSEDALQQQADRLSYRLNILKEMQEGRQREAEADLDRLGKFTEQAAQEAEEGKKLRNERDAERIRRLEEEQVESAKVRYGIALGQTFDARDPYGSLAKAAMTEYAHFQKSQERMLGEMAGEKDPLKKREIELRRNIAANEYMAITSDRLAGITAVIAGREDAPQAKIDRERAAHYWKEGEELRKERSVVLAEQREQQKQREEARGQQPGQTAQAAGPQHASSRAESTNSKKAEEALQAKASGRTEGEAELGDAAQVRRDRMRQNLSKAMGEKNTQQPTQGRGGGQSR